MGHCSLFSHSVKLPEWGFDQQEVTCIKNGKIEKTVWYIESTENSQCKLCLNGIQAYIKLIMFHSA